MEQIKELQTTLTDLRKSLDEMDEQARLVVRTDMELNKAQEELDKKINGLYTLQRLSRIISTALEESQIFKRLEISHLEDLGFEKAVVFLWDKKARTFSVGAIIGYLPDEEAAIKYFIESDKELYLNLIEKEKTISSITISEHTTNKGRLADVFHVKSFVISPILPKEGNKGMLFVGTENTDTLITEGDEELITILANQLGQSLENARLFEQTWVAQQELEKKVEERTRELKTVLDEVKIISKRKTDFISSVSHELRTPLTSIKGYAAILLAGKLGAIPEEVRERLDKINRHSDELVHMVNDLLDIARIESGRMTMKQESQNLGNIIEQAADLLSVQCKEKDIQLNVDVSGITDKVLADRSQIERVLINLLGNAVKFTPAKGKISVRAHKEKGKIQVDITDTGCGIPKKDQEAIFEEFYRVDNDINQHVKGTGLGLSLVKHIIKAHAGEIWVQSSEGNGSTFSFTLPTS